MLLAPKFFAENLQYLRSRKRLSQRELAQALGLTRSQVASYENGKAEPSTAKLAEIVRFFNVSLVRLVREDLQKESAPWNASPETPASRSMHLHRDDSTSAILGFENRSVKMRKIAEGLLALHEIKKSNLRELSPEVKSLQRDVETLFDFANNLMLSNEELISYLKTVAGSDAPAAPRPKREI